MVWAGIHLNGTTDLVLVPPPALNAERYRDEILAVHVEQHKDMHPGMIFMQDNARPHTSRICQEWLTEHQVHVMDWPAQSPDLNVIEHAWDWLKRRVRRRVPRPANVAELYQVAVEEWQQLPAEYLQALFDSCSDRCAAVIQVRGGNTRF